MKTSKPEAKRGGLDLGGCTGLPALIMGKTDARGYEFRCLRRRDGFWIGAGCRLWTSFAEARAHYGPEYASGGDQGECLSILDDLENAALAKEDAA